MKNICYDAESSTDYIDDNSFWRQLLYLCKCEFDGKGQGLISLLANQKAEIIPHL